MKQYRIIKIVSYLNVIIYILCEKLNYLTKSYLCVVFNIIKYNDSNYVIILHIIGVNKFIYI